MRNTHSQTLLTGATATGPSVAATVSKFCRFTFFFGAAGVTVGGTIVIESQAAEGSWAVVHTQAISASGTTVAQFDGVHTALRANLTTRTDGAYTVSFNASDSRP